MGAPLQGELVPLQFVEGGCYFSPFLIADPHQYFPGDVVALLDEFELEGLRGGPVGFLKALLPLFMKDMRVDPSDEDFAVLEGTPDLDDFLIVLGVVFGFFGVGFAEGECVTAVQTYILFNQLHIIYLFKNMDN